MGLSPSARRLTRKTVQGPFSQLVSQEVCKVGDWLIFRRETHAFSLQTLAENMCLSPSRVTLQVSWQPDGGV